MNAAVPCPATSTVPEPFQLLWTVAMSGRRNLLDEVGARLAVREELGLLLEAAKAQKAGLVAVSSIAKGADLIFAEECLAAGVPWKGLLPFPKEEFRKDQFTEYEWQRVVSCLDGAFAVETTCCAVPTTPTERDAAYRECGHRTMEAGDVIFIIAERMAPARDDNPTGSSDVDSKDKAACGADAMAEYARALSKPVWQWNPETQTSARHGWPGEGEWKSRMLFRSRVTPLIVEAAARPEPEPVDKEPCDDSPKSACHLGLEALYRRLDAAAREEQGDSQTLMEKVIRSHLLATGAAALSVTVLAASYRGLLPMEWRWLAISAAILFAFAVIAKPWLALRAWCAEKDLHELRSREHWVEARVAAELCRSAMLSWRFPQAPLALFTEEDFPHFKRLIRTLRLARELDRPQATPITEARAFQLYAQFRIGGQIKYFGDNLDAASKENALWQRRFTFATWTVILLGTAFGIAEALDALRTAVEAPSASDNHGWSHWLHLLAPVLSFILVVAPFYASYALAVLAIRDSRRRSERYKSMREFLLRQQKRVDQIKSPASRIAVVENTERMLLEELHEWYSVMRAVRV